jgi:hypothetical protein
MGTSSYENPNITLPNPFRRFCVGGFGSYREILIGEMVKGEVSIGALVRVDYAGF